MASIYILFPLGSLSPSWLFWKSNTAQAGARGRMQPRKLQSFIWSDSINRVYNFWDFVCSLFPKAIPFDFYSTLFWILAPNLRRILPFKSSFLFLDFAYYYCSLLYLTITRREPVLQAIPLRSNIVSAVGSLTCTGGVTVRTEPSS